ncbi:MAG: alpha/beta hydrolase [Nitrososphaerota archaeon]|nr:alpha/beta hydrolase [Nitrososphaerota archaeon]MDG6947088.1 alpha/beta hydrolase [Nitrososphaerota archaeon]MDG6951363.1 alpha/beta hydrolase [Nitrososphaerota archaeon]
MLESDTYEAPRDTVFVHGAGGNSLLWRRTLQYLSGGARAFAVNLPGHPSGEITCKSIGDYAESVHSFIAELGLKRPAVCGHSMGGAIVLDLAISHPDDLGALVLVSTGAKLGVNQLILDGLRDQPMSTIEKVITPWSFSSIDLGLGREARTALSISNLPVFLNDYLACQGFDVRSELPKIGAKTLIVCGDKDRMTPPSWSEYLNANIQGSELHFVNGSGHMLPLERPQALARVIQSFLSGLTQ